MVCQAKSPRKNEKCKKIFFCNSEKKITKPEKKPQRFGTRFEGLTSCLTSKRFGTNFGRIMIRSPVSQKGFPSHEIKVVPVMNKGVLFSSNLKRRSSFPCIFVRMGCHTRTSHTCSCSCCYRARMTAQTSSPHARRAARSPESREIVGQRAANRDSTERDP